MLHLHLANRIETLVHALATLQRADPLPLLESETVVAPSTALARWLDFRLAEALGIATQRVYAFPAALAWQWFGRVLPDVAARNPFDRTSLHWRLLRLLAACPAPEIRHYLAGDDGTRLYELAERVAALFDRYLVERPDWMAAWRAGRSLGLGADEAWQASLWRALVAELPNIPAEHPRERFLAALRAEPALRQRLPRRVSLFCVEAMPALYWEVFVALAEWLELHVFVLTPCREYWGDLSRLRTRLRLELAQPEQAALYEVGHPLLASLGRARQYATMRLAALSEQVACREESDFTDAPKSLLGRLQQDILDLAMTPAALDDSLQIHDCHGAQREAEVLHDRLLACFEQLPGLQPADILILTPDIETYGPIVAAVLAQAAEARRIPCRIADRPLAQLPLWRALRRCCETAAGDLDAESVLMLLDEPAVRRAFDLAESDLPRLRDWVRAAGIRWGLDAAARARRGLPADEAFTWRAGLARLLLGVAFPDAPERLWQEKLPVKGIEGEGAEMLGRFLDFLEALFALAAQTHGEKAPLAWVELLKTTFERCLAPEETEEEQAERLRATLTQLETQLRETACTTPLPLAVLLRELDTRLAELAPARDFVSGAATIAALQPGRPVAARVLCLVGMNDGAWPRLVTPLPFDLMAAQPRPGDRDARAEERYAFLEALLGARERLIITYAGRDARSNLEQPPAAPLAELIDVLSAMTGCGVDEVVVRHPLQPFARDYFDGQDERLFSYDEEHCPPAATLAAPAFLRETLALEAPAEVEVDLAELQRFFAHPVKYFLRERLGLLLEEQEALLEIHEPFVPDALERYHLCAAQFAALEDGQSPEETQAWLRARGELPSGVAGELVARRARQEALGLWQAAQPWLAARTIEGVEIDYAAHGVRLTGRLEGLTERGLWRVRHGRLRAQDRLRLWIEHLLFNLAAPDGVLLTSTLIARDATLQLGPVAQAKAHLAELLGWYRAGLMRPLPFYPETAWAWMMEKGTQQPWQGNPFRDRKGERDDAYVRLFLRDRTDDPLGEEFQRLAMAIFGPLRAALKVGAG